MPCYHQAAACTQRQSWVGDCVQIRTSKPESARDDKLDLLRPPAPSLPMQHARCPVCASAAPAPCCPPPRTHLLLPANLLRRVFGWTKKNEINNGRWVMMGIAIGLMTEYATGVSFIDQLRVGLQGGVQGRAGRAAPGARVMSTRSACLSHAAPSLPRTWRDAHHRCGPPVRPAAHGLLHGPGGPGLSCRASGVELQPGMLVVSAAGPSCAYAALATVRWTLPCAGARPSVSCSPAGGRQGSLPNRSLPCIPSVPSQSLY